MEAKLVYAHTVRIINVEETDIMDKQVISKVYGILLGHEYRLHD